MPSEPTADFDERRRRSRGCVPKILMVVAALLAGWWVVFQLPFDFQKLLSPLRKEPKVWLAYEVDVTAAYDAAPSEPASVLEATRLALETRLRPFFGRNVTVGVRGREVVVGLPRLDAAALRDVESIIQRSGRVEVDRVIDTPELFGGATGSLPPPADEGIALSHEDVPDGPGPDGQTKLVQSTYAYAALAPEQHRGESMEECRQRLLRWLQTFSVPQDRQILLQPVREASPSPSTTRIDRGWRTFYVARPPGLTSKDLQDAEVAQDTNQPNQSYYVAVTLSPQGAQRFEELTATNLQRRLAIVVDGVVDSAPVVKAKISGGRVSISVTSSQIESEQRLEASRLAVELTLGALPAPLRFLRVDGMDSSDGGV